MIHSYHLIPFDYKRITRWWYNQTRDLTVGIKKMWYNGVSELHCGAKKTSTPPCPSVCSDRF